MSGDLRLCGCGHWDTEHVHGKVWCRGRDSYGMRCTCTSYDDSCEEKCQHGFVDGMGCRDCLEAHDKLAAAGLLDDEEDEEP